MPDRESQPTRRRDIFDLDRALAWLSAVKEVEVCRRAIKQHAELGISGNEHDLEHRRMLADAMMKAREVRP